MNRRRMLGGALAAMTISALRIAWAARRRPSNFVVVLCDDLGYGDLEPYGGSIPTPSINRMARQGLIATNYYCPANLCTPSRAGLLTGRYPVRTGLGYEVILEDDDRALPLSEKTIAGALKPDYATALFGKWHLGHRNPKWLPTNYGFDEFFGIPYSHDIFPLELYEATAQRSEATESPVDLPMLQQRFYSHAEAFIERHREHPFFVELALSAPHLPAHVNPEFKGRTLAGPYGDTVAEIDSIVGRLLNKLKALELERDTLVLLTSDNGPWFEGSSGPLRDRKGGAGYDGGYRVPFVAWAPGLIPAGVKTDALICGIDLLPTFCTLAGRTLPSDVQFDGRDITGVLTGRASSPHDQILLFNNEEIVGIRTQRWKYVEQSYYRSWTFPMDSRGYPQLYDMSRDIAESYSVAETHPDVAADMQLRLKRAKEAYAPFKRGVPPSIQRRIQERTRRTEP